MRAIMVQGTSSWAGKSLLATVLCRHFARQGMSVAPFKAQNMSNNARVVAGGEIGTAQYLQALAARATPDVRMNPVLVKPETDRTSQVIIRGVADPAISAMPWRARPTHLWAAIEDSLRSLSAAFELVVIEGAGSPAEINLRDTDLANMRVARLADAPVIIVADIERGGALAHLYGTWALLDAQDRQRVRGFVLNRFRGELALLDPAPRQLQELTGVPTLGVVPLLAHGLPDEDGAAAPRPLAHGRRVAIVRYPTASNLDEFKRLEEVAAVVWAVRPADLDDAELIILPGSKHVSRDLAWLRAARLEAPLRAHVRSELAPTKRLAARTQARFATLSGPWSALSGLTVAGYEIRHGHTSAHDPVQVALPNDLGWFRGPVLGCYLHGLLESPEILHATLGAAPTQSLDETIDRLTDGVMAALDERRLEALISPS